MSDASKSIDGYIASFPPNVRGILRKIRATVRQAAPDAEEMFSYRMPALRQGGILIYYAAFRHHIGVFPPVRGDARLVKAAARYAGPKGNLKLPYDRPMPYALLARIVKSRVKENTEKAARRKGG
jgi:uncharacterized protein YdhG (YjbR/CyaY superfamily)